MWTSLVLKFNMLSSFKKVTVTTVLRVLTSPGDDIALCS